MNAEEISKWEVAYAEAYPGAPVESAEIIERAHERAVKEKNRRLTEVRKLENAIFLLDYWTHKNPANEIERIRKEISIEVINDLIDELEEKIVSRETSR